MRRGDRCGYGYGHGKGYAVASGLWLRALSLALSSARSPAVSLADSHADSHAVSHALSSAVRRAVGFAVCLWHAVFMRHRCSKHFHCNLLQRKLHPRRVEVREDRLPARLHGVVEAVDAPAQREDGLLVRIAGFRRRELRDLTGTYWLR